MSIKVCKNGHEFDTALYAVCPICGSGPKSENEPGGTIALSPDGTIMGGGAGSSLGGSGTAPVFGNDFFSSNLTGGSKIPINGFGGTVPAEPFIPNGNAFGGAPQAGGKLDLPPTAPVSQSFGRPNSSPAAKPYGVTMPAHNGISGMPKNTRALVGWIVCIEGANKGQDYRICEGYNNIGRNKTPENDIVIPDDPAISGERCITISYEAKSNTYYVSREKTRNFVYHNGEPVHGDEQLINGDTIQIGDSTFIFVALCNDKFKWN